MVIKKKWSTMGTHKKKKKKKVNFVLPFSLSKTSNLKSCPRILLKVDKKVELHSRKNIYQFSKKNTSNSFSVHMILFLLDTLHKDS